MKKQILTVIAVAIMQDKNGRDYKNVKVSSPSEINGVKIEAKTSSFNAMKENYLPVKDGEQPKSDFGWDLNKGDKIMGAFVTRDVESYDIHTQDAEGNDVTRTARTATVIAKPLPGQFEITEIAIRRAFANAGHNLLEASEEATPEEGAEADAVPNVEAEA